jgi:hypothetical protein
MAMVFCGADMNLQDSFETGFCEYENIHVRGQN